MPSSSWSGCSVSNSGSQVDISGSTTHPGTRPTAPDAGGREPGPQTPPPAPPCPLNRCDLDYEVVGLPDVTASDLVSFRPAQPSLAGEPEGLGVLGMPTNVVGAASEQRIAGSLLGYDVVVRFTPVGYVFDYGDGTLRRSSSGGSTWERLGQPQFTPTSTSHTYAARGEYRVAVTVEYAASVDFGSGTWRPVAGLVSATTGGYGVRVVEVRTALVDRSCTEDPSGPGC
ncbi:hypothetical protein [Microbacterium sp. RU33B]|uniref:hypothetical protein n=1 Tax=Microbacterium sp. RU33B TaxID=1907390 RepID=UPI00095B4430|nr:hypothetical protein [Microbacterium sp. RU33B]SIT76549.1 hypothetical protein SAMN05880545_1610 [Microbacterium sp. RU33B]